MKLHEIAKMQGNQVEKIEYRYPGMYWMHFDSKGGIYFKDDIDCLTEHKIGPWDLIRDDWEIKKKNKITDFICTGCNLKIGMNRKDENEEEFIARWNKRV